MIPNNNTTTLKTSFALKATPNPTTEQVTFSFSLPKEMQKATILIRDINGKTIHQIELSPNSTRVNYKTSHLSRGIYLYSLVIDDTIQATKKLVIIK